jgi:hypothetical protein
MALLREIPIIGIILEKSGLLLQGDVPKVEGEGFFGHLLRRVRSTTINTYDLFGFHEFQHHKTDAEVRRLLEELQPDSQKILNLNEYFSGHKIGCALRVFR